MCMNGTDLCIRFSYITNHLRYCGPFHAEEQFLQYAKHHNNEYQVQQSLQKFEALYPYLSLIAEKTGKQAFDHDVVESYWLGNRLLEEFQDNDMKRIIEMLVQRGLPLSLGTELVKNMPHGLFPHHNFNVFYVGVGKTTGAVPTTLQNMDNCRDRKSTRLNS